jgi:hypothetical protein
MVELHVEPALHDQAMAHLRSTGSAEQAAFMFALRRSDTDMFDVVEGTLMGRDDLAHQYSDYLELTDEARARLIKRAHALGASLVEMHSHPFPLPAAFSLADREGLRETVPHMWWRLANRPYFAIVIGPSDFDALAWLDNPRVPRALDALIAGEARLMPTNNSLKGWR